MKKYYYNLTAMLIMAFSSLAYSADPLYAPDYADPGGCVNPGPNPFLGWNPMPSAYIGTSNDGLYCAWISSACGAPTVGWTAALCTGPIPNNPSCPYGGHTTAAQPQTCTEVPWNNPQNPTTCTSGQTVSMCAPGSGDSGSTLVIYNGCVYAPSNVSNQWAVEGVPSRCGEWSNTGFVVDAAQDSDKTEAQIPDAADITPVDTVPAGPPGIVLPGDDFQDPQNGNDVDPLIDANLPDPDPANPQIDVSKLAKETTLIAGVNKLIAASQNVVTAVNNGMRQLYNKSQEQLNALLAASTKLSTIDGSVKGVGTAVTGVGTAVTGLSGGISDVKDSVDKITEQPTNPDEEIEEQEKEMGLIQPVSIDSTASCPADLSFSVLGYPMAFSFGLVCDGANMLRPLILSIAWLSAGVIFIGGVRNG